jgi:phosphoglucosamine mutase
MPRLFGTDGVRGVANRDLTPDLALALGRAAGRVLAPTGGEVVVGRDTRVSGPMLEGAVVAGLCSAGVDVGLVGIIPSPGVAFLTVDREAPAGAVISASHNPVTDNGIKFFSPLGFKIEGDIEDEIEAAMTSIPDGLPTGAEVGTARLIEGAGDRYLDHLSGAVDAPLAPLKVVLDCAFGAAFEIAPEAFRRAGAEVIAINDTPDGRRINVDCGSTSLGGLGRVVVDAGADLGIAFDGDADRALAVDETGEVVDGDRILGMCALWFHDAGTLKNNLVVGTVMTNLGFLRALAERGIEVLTAPVGDKYVAEMMAQHGAVIGGEQSGHIIFSDYATTGDGILTALKVAEILAAADEPLSSMAHFFEPYPQVLVNVPVAERGTLEETTELWDEIHRAENALGADGRVLVRESGTEMVVRVMVEAADETTARGTAEALAEEVRGRLG